MRWERGPILDCSQPTVTVVCLRGSQRIRSQHSKGRVRVLPTVLLLLEDGPPLRGTEGSGPRLAPFLPWSRTRDPADGDPRRREATEWVLDAHGSRRRGPHRSDGWMRWTGTETCTSRRQRPGVDIRLIRDSRRTSNVRRPWVRVDPARVSTDGSRRSRCYEEGTTCDPHR